jgi:hypothetical protein
MNFAATRVSERLFSSGEMMGRCDDNLVGVLVTARFDQVANLGLGLGKQPGNDRPGDPLSPILASSIAKKASSRLTSPRIAGI